jgi:hypothetical protein
MRHLQLLRQSHKLCWHKRDSHHNSILLMGKLIDQNNTLTTDESPKRRPGRPPSVKALTPTQRKASQRHQNFTNICKQVEDIDFNKLPITALLEYLPRAIKAGRVSVVEA